MNDGICTNLRGVQLLTRALCGNDVNSLWPSDVIWRQGSRSTLDQVMAWCLRAPSHYLNQCWLIIDEAPRHSSQGIILRRCEDTNQWNEIENCSFKMASRSPRGQWGNARPWMSNHISKKSIAEITYVHNIHEHVYVFSIISIKSD